MFPAPDPAPRPEPPTQPSPDDKDWTWVLERPCPECSFDPAPIEPGTLPARLAEATSGWAVVLARPGAAQRPAPDVWSPLEYGCHVRDVLRLFADRARLMLEQDDPLFANWDQDATAVSDRYADQSPAIVADEIAAAAHEAARVFARPTAQQWQRPGRRSNGSRFTVASLGSYFLHDLVHHRWDVAG